MRLPLLHAAKNSNSGALVATLENSVLFQKGAAAPTRASTPPIPALLEEKGWQPSALRQIGVSNSATKEMLLPFLSLETLLYGAAAAAITSPTAPTALTAKGGAENFTLFFSRIEGTAGIFPTGTRTGVKTGVATRSPATELKPILGTSTALISLPAAFENVEGRAENFYGILSIAAPAIEIFTAPTGGSAHAAAASIKGLCAISLTARENLSPGEAAAPACVSLAVGNSPPARTGGS